MGRDIEDMLRDINGLRCAKAKNPFGSTLILDFGELLRPRDSLPNEKPRGWRRLTVYSPWRVQTNSEILFDWNVDGGAKGLLLQLLKPLEGLTVSSAIAKPPAWDLAIGFSNGLHLVVFGDFDDEREDAWFITGIDGSLAAARPRSRPLPTQDTKAEP